MGSSLGIYNQPSVYTSWGEKKIGFSLVRVLVPLWTISCQAPLSLGFSRLEYWSGMPCSPPGDLPDSGIEPESPALQGYSLLLSHHGSPGSSLST